VTVDPPQGPESSDEPEQEQRRNPLISSTPIGGWTDPNPNRPTSPVPGYVAAGTASRIVAYAIDGIVLLLVNLLVTAIIDPSAYDLGAPLVPEDQLSTALFVGRIVAIGVEFAYFVGFWTSRGRATPGMRLLRISVIDAAADRPLRRVPAAARWLLLSGAIGLIGVLPVAGDFFGLVSLIWISVLLVSMAINPLRQGIHDQAAGSFVVQRIGVASNALLMGCLVLIVIFIVLPLVGLILLGPQIEEILRQAGQSI
jgi:uncharacterized RDD family membrane protein YckC